MLINSSVAASDDPVGMAGALRGAVNAGRAARMAGHMSVSREAAASSSLTAFLSQASDE